MFSASGKNIPWRPVLDRESDIANAKRTEHLAQHERLHVHMQLVREDIPNNIRRDVPRVTSHRQELKASFHHDDTLNQRKEEKGNGTVNLG